MYGTNFELQKSITIVPTTYPTYIEFVCNFLQLWIYLPFKLFSSIKGAIEHFEYFIRVNALFYINSSLICSTISCNIPSRNRLNGLIHSKFVVSFPRRTRFLFFFFLLLFINSFIRISAVRLHACHSLYTSR